MDGCRCPQCYGLREYMLERLGQDYGLPVAVGHTYVAARSEEPCFGYANGAGREDRSKRKVIRQPWEARPISARHRRAA